RAICWFGQLNDAMIALVAMMPSTNDKSLRIILQLDKAILYGWFNNKGSIECPSTRMPVTVHYLR
ncbi:MAG: hypothetical protein ABI240_15815, partial [Sphingomonas sp.]